MINKILLIVILVLVITPASIMGQYQKMPQIPTGGPWYAERPNYLQYQYRPDYSRDKYYYRQYNHVDRVYTVPGGMRYYFYIQ